MDFTVVDDYPVWFFGITGTVKGLHNWSNTAVSSSINAAGHIQISSNTTDKQNFWIIADSGREYEAKDVNLSCRDGQKVTLIWGASKDEKIGKYLLFFNHNTNLKEKFISKSAAAAFKSTFPSIGEEIFIILLLISCITIITIPICILFFSIFNKRAENRMKIYVEFSEKFLDNPSFMKEIS